jgi:NADH dehydrogenase
MKTSMPHPSQQLSDFTRRISLEEGRAAQQRRRTRVVVIGCGFGGLEAVRRLCRGPVEVVLIDRTNHHLFQPLLYQVATATVSAPVISAPIRHILRREIQRGNLTVLRAEVRHIDAKARTVWLDDTSSVEYEHLIVAAGATHSYYGRDEWQRVAPGLKTLADAFRIRAKVIEAFEKAELSRDLAERQGWLNFVVIGGGPTGVELAGALVDLARHTLAEEFRRIDCRRARIVLLEGSPRLLSAFEPDVSESARLQLEALGVDVYTGCSVTDIDDHGVIYQQGPGGQREQRLQAHTVLWAAGVAASPLGCSLAQTAGAHLDRTGRIQVEPDLSLGGHPEISVVGDLACARSYGGTKPQCVPAVSPAAKQMGRTAADNLLRRIAAEPTQSFRYRNYGALATIGRKAAVVQLEAPLLGKLKWSGPLAWLFWLLAHVYFLIGFRNRIALLFDWTWCHFTLQRSARVVAEPHVSAAKASSR